MRAIPYGRPRTGLVGRATLAFLLALAPLAASAALSAQQSDGSVIERAVANRVKGGEDAPLVVFEIADFQCPYCRQFAADMLPHLEREFIDTGKVQWVFVNLPLHTHRRAWVAAEAALCAGGVGDKFWAMHDRLFARQDEWVNADDPNAIFSRYARELDVPDAPFRTCINRDQVATLLLQDVSSVMGAQITGTPTFIVMSGDQVIQRVVGIRSVDEWRTLLQEALDGDGG